MKGLPTGDGGTVMLAGGSMKPSGQVGMQMHSNEGHAGLHFQIITPYIYTYIYIYKTNIYIYI